MKIEYWLQRKPTGTRYGSWLWEDRYHHNNLDDARLDIRECRSLVASSKWRIVQRKITNKIVK